MARMRRVMAWCRVATTDCGRTAGFQKQEKSEMTKQLREWTAPDGGETYRWDPTVNYVQRKVGETWVCVFDATEILDHAAALNALRADPYVAPKGLREQIGELVNRAYMAGVNHPNGDWRGTEPETDALLALIDRERPALGEVEMEVLVGELVRRGWGDWGNRHDNEFRYVGMRRVLIAPERGK